MATTQKQYTVRAAHCDYRASEEEIYQTLRRITDPLARSCEKIERANTVAIKLNMMKLQERIVYFEGRRRELVDDAVARATFRLLRSTLQVYRELCGEFARNEAQARRISTASPAQISRPRRSLSR